MASSDTNSAGDFQLLIKSFVSFFLGVPAIVTNVVLLFTIYRDPNRNKLWQKPVTLLVVNLGVCDLLSGAVPGCVSFVYGIYRLHQGDLLVMKIMVIVGAIVTNIVASCTISAMSVERWFLVSSPFQHKAYWTRKRIKAFILVIWAYSLLFQSLYATGVSNTVFVLLYCHFHVSVPLIILPVVYWRTYRALHLHNNRVQNLWTDRRQRKAFAERTRERKVISAILSVLVLFYVSFIPHFIANNLKVFQPSLSETAGFELFFYVANSLTLVNCSINPFIYAWRIPQYRQAFKAVFKRWICRITVANKTEDVTSISSRQSDTVK